MEKNIQISTVALVRVTDGLLKANCNIKESIKKNLDAISLLGHVSQDFSSLRLQKLKPALHPKCAGLCDLEYTETKQLFGEDISKSLVKAKEVGGLRKECQPKGQSIKIDSSTILQKILFSTRALTSTRDHHKPETTETGDR